MTTTTEANKLPFTQDQLLNKINRDDSCAINALFKLLEYDSEILSDDKFGILLGDRGFLSSLQNGVVWRQREHERGINLHKPLLSDRQFVYLRIKLEKYLDELYFIAKERAGLSKDALEPRGCYCHKIPCSLEPTICGYCDSH